MTNRLLLTGLATGLMAILLLSMFAGCKRDRFNLNKLTSTNWEPSVAFPLVNADLDVYDVMAHIDSSDLVVIDPLTGQVALVYEGQLYSFAAQDIIDLPDQSFNTSLSLNLPQVDTLIMVGQVNTTVTIEDSIALTSGVQADSVTFLNGTMDINISSDYQHDAIVQILIPGLVKDGQALQQTLNLNYQGMPVSATQSIDISGYTMDLTNGGMGGNVVEVIISVTLINSGNGISGTEEVEVNIGYSNLDFESIFGNFGQQQISLDTDSILIRIFSNTSSGTFMLNDPKLNIYIENSFGFPVEVLVDPLESHNTVSGQVTPILLSNFDNPFAINFPNITEIGQSEFTSLTIDNTNSNITTLMEPTPKYLVHSITATSNPTGSPGAYNFLRHDSRFVVDTELELPLVGWANNWGLVDTVSFTFEEDNIEEIESLFLRVNYTNHFPVNARMQLYLLDENFAVLDSLMPSSQDLVQSGVLDASGRVIQETVTITDIPYDQSRVPNLYKARYLRIWADSESTDADEQREVRIYDNYYMKVRLGMMINANIEI